MWDCRHMTGAHSVLLARLGLELDCFRWPWLLKSQAKATGQWKPGQQNTNQCSKYGLWLSDVQAKAMGHARPPIWLGLAWPLAFRLGQLITRCTLTTHFPMLIVVILTMIWIFWGSHTFEPCTGAGGSLFWVNRTLGAVRDSPKNALNCTEPNPSNTRTFPSCTSCWLIPTSVWQLKCLPARRETDAVPYRVWQSGIHYGK